MQDSSIESAHASWKGLFMVGGVATVLIAVVYLITLIVYVPANLAAPPPANVIEWFTIFQQKPVTAFFFLGLGDILIMILTAPMILALYAALKDTSRTWMAIATGLTFVGMAVYLATNSAFTMHALSQQYAAAKTGAEQTLIEAAGVAILATIEGTGGRYLGLPLVWAASMITSVVMLRSKFFNKVTAYIGILGFVFLIIGVPFATYTSVGTPSAIETAIIFLSYFAGGLLSMAWYILVGLRLTRLGRGS